MASSAYNNSSDVQVRSSANSSEFDEALSEFHLMLRYALAEGFALDDSTRQAVTAVQQRLVASVGMPAGVEAGIVDFGQLMAAHAALSKIIAPATPLSLKATEPAPGRLGSLRRPPLIMAMIIVAIIAAIGFVVTSVLFGPSNPSSVGEKLNWCFAAALGAVFYVLFTAHNYVKDRTFDPRYNSLYVIRFVLGVLAGLILAIVLGAPLLSKNSTVSSLGPAVIVLLGGFSTEAVYQILQRLVDMLLAAVRGDDSNAAKARASQDARTELLGLADDAGCFEIQGYRGSEEGRCVATCKYADSEFLFGLFVQGRGFRLVIPVRIEEFCAPAFTFAKQEP